jgi:hypothetical protein
MTKRGKEWAPAGAVQFQPTQAKLLPVQTNCGLEYVHSSSPEHAGVLFDPWKRGDIVAVMVAHSSWHQGQGHQKYETWHIGTRASIPSAARLKVALGPENTRLVEIQQAGGKHLFRIPYRYQGNAAKVMWLDFDSRAALEAALAGIVQQEAAA